MYLSQPENKILYNDNGETRIVKGIELNPEINSKALAEIAILSATSFTNIRGNKKS